MREVERRVVLSVLDRKWREHLYEMDYLREGVSLRGYGQRDPLIEYQREGYDMFTTMMDGIKEDSVGSLFNLQVQVQENPIMAEDGADGSAGPVISLTQAAPADTGPVASSAPAARTAAGSRPGPAGTAAAGPGSASPAAQAQQLGRPGSAAQRRRRTPTPAESPSGASPRPRPPAAVREPELQRASEDASGRAEHSTGSAVGAEFANVGRNAPCPCGSGRKFKLCHGDPRNR